MIKDYGEEFQEYVPKTFFRYYQTVLSDWSKLSNLDKIHYFFVNFSVNRYEKNDQVPNGSYKYNKRKTSQALPHKDKEVH